MSPSDDGSDRRSRTSESAGPTTGQRSSHATDRPWEVACGYSRAVRVGPYAETALCSPCAPDGTVLHPGDVYRQTLACLDLIRESLEAVGMTMADVVKTRIYVVNPEHWKESGRAHGEVFADIRPALGWIYMSSFFAPGITVEVEATAYRAA